MGLIDGSDFQPSHLFREGHFSTIVPTVFGKKPKIHYIRERINTPDDDFLDIDMIKNGNKRLLILCHGLEGSSESLYMLIFAHHFSQKKWDIAAMNYRGCSGEINNNLRMYNSGTTNDLDLVVQSVLGLYDEIVLIGFSLGGNLVLKFLGEDRQRYTQVRGGIALSTPVHLSDASQKLLEPKNKIYQWRFLRTLKDKIKQKAKQFPDQVSLEPLSKIKNLYDFDDVYTAPLFGYQDAEDYYAHNQSIQWLHLIDQPALIINALNDPFLGPLSYPKSIVETLKNVDMIIPDFGGHVGFAHSINDRSWVLNRVSSFVSSIC